MPEYTTINGDTYDSIARKVYGTETRANLVRNSNPGLIEPIGAGVSIVLPRDPSVLSNTFQRSLADDPDEVSIFINGKRFRYYPEVTITRAIDSFSTFQLDAPFEPDNDDFRKAFVPFSFARVEMNVGGDPVFTGTMIKIEPSLGDNTRTLSVSGYSLPGVLNDCTLPESLAPLEFSEMGLRDIAKTIAILFGIDVQFDADQGPIFDPAVACEPDKRALEFIAGLTKQRSLVISDTADGKMLFQQSIDTYSIKPVATLRQGESPMLSVIPEFDPQNYYSHITGIAPPLFGEGDGEKFTVKNPFVKKTFRPLTFKVPDVQPGSLADAVNAKVGRMFANMVGYSVEVPTWRDPNGDLWQPNTVVILNAPGAMVYNDYRFLIRDVEFRRNANGSTATLKLILPGSFSGTFPGGLPWD